LWITSCEINGLERATIENYRQHLRLHIVPYLGRLKLAQLSVPLIRKFEDDLRTGKSASEQHEDERRSASMIKRVVVSLGSLIADAQERGLVAQNVVRSLRAHRKRGKERQAEKRQKGKPKVGVDIPTPGEIKTMIAHLKGQWRPLLLTAIFTGLRSSELRGLRWADVDLKKARLHVRQRADRYQVIGKPKSEAGERTVPLPPIVVSTLREWKVACPQIDQDLCFPTAVRYRADRPGGKRSTTSTSSDAVSCLSRKRRESSPKTASRNTPGCIRCGTFMRPGSSIASRMAAWDWRPRWFRNAWGIRVSR
jgi:integrase